MVQYYSAKLCTEHCSISYAVLKFILIELETNLTCWNAGL